MRVFPFLVFLFDSWEKKFYVLYFWCVNNK
jgi:hypothetical protein